MIIRQVSYVAMFTSVFTLYELILNMQCEPVLHNVCLTEAIPYCYWVTVYLIVFSYVFSAKKGVRLEKMYKLLKALKSEVYFSSFIYRSVS